VAGNGSAALRGVGVQQLRDRIAGCALLQDGTQLNLIDDIGAGRLVRARACSREACLAVAAKMEQSPTRWFCR
jgi:hypothetical protein